MFESYLYHPENGLRTDVSIQEMPEVLRDPRQLLWIDMQDIDDRDIDLLTAVFNLHPLTVEDLIIPNARPKVENFGEYISLVMFALQSQNGQQKDRLKTIELDCCLGKNFLITFHTDALNSLTLCKERIRKQSPIIMHGADMLLYSILDSCVDSYFPVINAFDNLVDEMSDELFKDPTQDTLEENI